MNGETIAPEPALIQDDDAAIVGPPWKLLLVTGDDKIVALMPKTRFRGRPVAVIRVPDAVEARALLQRENDVALVIIALPADRNALDLSGFIRVDLGNSLTRLALLSVHPVADAGIEDGEIDAQALVADLTPSTLGTLIVTALRGYESLSALTEANRALESRLAARVAELGRLAMIDTVTGLANRRHFEARAAIEIAEADSIAKPLTLLAIDVDRMQRINESFGQEAGDLVLRQVGEAAAGSIRPGDLVARIGGAEFAVILPDTALADGRPVADRIRRRVEALMIKAGFATIRATVSIGVAALLAGEAAIEPVLARADAALYVAKQAGRNQVMVT